MKRSQPLIAFISIGFLSCFTLLNSCKKCTDDPYIDSFAFNDLTPVAIGEINNSKGTIEVTVPETADVSALTPTITLANPECHSVLPASNSSQDFSVPVLYKVSNEAGDSREYTVTVSQTEGSMEISWQSGTPMPLPLAFMPVAELDNKIYLMGGAVDDVSLSGQIYIYDPLTDTWDDSKATIPVSRFAHSASVLDGKIYVIGGAPAAEADALNDIQVYDPETDSWTESIIMPTPRAAHGSCVLDGKLYLVGGELKEPTGDSTIDDVSVYDPATGKWTTLAPLPTRRAYLSVNVINGKIYAAGGSSGYVDATDVLEVYDPSTDIWTSKSALPKQRLGMGSCVINGRIFYLGGASLAITIGTPSVQVYSPEEDNWVNGTSLEQFRLAPGICSWQGKIIVIGGSDSSFPWPSNTPSVEIGQPVWTQASK